MQDIVNKLESARDQFDKHLTVLAKQKANTLAQPGGDGDAEVREGDIKGFETRCERELIGELTGNAILGEMFNESEVDRDRGVICGDLQQLKRTLEITLPVPHLMIPPIRYVLIAGIGAVLGIYAMAPLTRLLLGYHEVGLIIGGPVGAALAVAIAGYLAEHPPMRRMLMIALGAGAAAWLAMELLEKIPVAGLWQRIVGKKTGVMQTLKAVAAFLVVLFILWLVKPSRKTLRDQLEKSAEADILAWLRRHFDVMVLLAVMPRGANDKQSEPKGLSGEPVPIRLVEAIDRLTNQRDQLLDIAPFVDEVVQEYKQAGFRTTSERPTIYRRGLEQFYETVGVVSEGDPIEVLEPPVLRRDGSVVKSGRLWKKRR